jgi:hypothetical protein
LTWINALFRAPVHGHFGSTLEVAMSSHDFVVIVMIIAAFGAFGSTLGAVTWYASRDKAQKS